VVRLAVGQGALLDGQGDLRPTGTGDGRIGSLRYTLRYTWPKTSGYSATAAPKESLWIPRARNSMPDSEEKGPPGGLPIGKRFSHVYLERREPVPDSQRMRTRVHALFRRLKFHETDIGAAEVIERKLGIAVPHTEWGYNFDRWFAQCELRDLLDAITVLWVARGGQGQSVATAWRKWDSDYLSGRKHWVPA
jgi:hypothetical protein